MLTRKLIAAGCLSAAIGLTSISLAVAASPSHTVRLSSHLKVVSQATPTCHGAICTIHNRGTGTVAGFGNVTFTTVITDDATAHPCAGGSYVPRLRRAIRTSRGTLVLNEAGLLCLHPGIGPRVDLVWAVDSTQSTGAFHGATGTGSDHAFPQSTATQRGTITLAGNG